MKVISCKNSDRGFEGRENISVKSEYEQNYCPVLNEAEKVKKKKEKSNSEKKSHKLRKFSNLGVYSV